MSKQTVSESSKAMGIQAAHMPSGNIDPNLQAIMDSLQLADSNVYRILKGEIHELMDKQGQILIGLQQNIEEFKINNAAVPDNEANLLLAKIHNDLVSLGQTNDKIVLELQEYYKMVPYLLMLSPLMWLSNLSTKAVRDIQFRQSLMVQRDRCLRDDESDGFDDDNILDSIEILMHVMVAGAEKGWKSNVIRNEVREVKTTIEDHTSSGEKKKGGILGKFGI
jgi:hypothetical protein